MSTVMDQLQNVTPGDLIEADFFNKLLAAMRNLDQRVTSLEADTSTSPPSKNATITSLDPDDEIAVGEELRVYGTNFGLLAGAARAWVGSKQITAFKQGSTNNLLVFDVPDLTDTLPAVLAITAGNQFSTQQRPLTVQPRPVALIGGVTVTVGTADPANLPPNTDVFWPVTLYSEASTGGNYAITATVDQGAWQSGLQVLESKTGTTNLTAVALTPHVAKQLFVKVHIPDSTTGTKFTLSFGVSAPGGLSGGSQVTPQLTVGSAPPPVDTNITFSTPVGSPSSAWNASTSTVTRAVGQTEVISFSVKFTAVGDYDVTPTLALATPGSWTVAGGMANPPNPITVSQSQVDAGGLNQMLGYSINAVTSGANTDSLEVKVQKRNQTGTAKSTSLVLKLRNS